MGRLEVLRAVVRVVEPWGGEGWRVGGKSGMVVGWGMRVGFKAKLLVAVEVGWVASSISLIVE